MHFNSDYTVQLQINHHQNQSPKAQRSILSRVIILLSLADLDIAPLGFSNDFVV